jgi:Predicted membrane protein
MKLNRIIVLLAATATIATCSTGCVTEEKREAKLQAEAKVSKEQAEKTALAKVPGGTIKEGELEKEHGKLIWSFDISTPNSTDIKEVQVDAITGEVVSVKTESAAAEAKEKKKEKEEDEKDEKK